MRIRLNGDVINLTEMFKFRHLYEPVSMSYVTSFTVNIHSNQMFRKMLDILNI